jgi:hypothetical protein
MLKRAESFPEADSSAGPTSGGTTSSFSIPRKRAATETKRKSAAAEKAAVKAAQIPANFIENFSSDQA